MTDISKYKNVSLSKDTYTKIDKLRKIIVPNTIISRSQTVNILVNENQKNYLFELKDKRKFDYETLKHLNKEQFIKKIRV